MGLAYELQCQTNTAPMANSLTITVDSMTYNITQQFINNMTYISEVTVSEFMGRNVLVQCDWSINGASFMGSDIIEGETVLLF